MGSGAQGILTSLALEEGPKSPSANRTIKNKKNEKAAGQARAAGAKTATERALEGTLKQQDVLVGKMAEQQKAFKQKDNLNKILDKVGKLPPEQMYSEQAFNSVKTILPSIDKETYYNAIAPQAARRRALTKQLEALPIGTQLPEATMNELKDYGIDNPNQYMSIGLLEPQNTLMGAIQRTALGAARSGDGGPLSGYGATLQQNIDSLEKAKAQIQRDNQAEFEAKVRQMQSISETDKPLTKNQKANLTSKLSQDVKRDLKETDTVFEFWNNIRDFSNTDRPRSVIRMVGDDTLKGGLKAVEQGSNKDLQNVADIGLVYSFIKMLDPGSVVREGEIALANRSLGLLEGIGVKADNIMNGETLSDQQRAGIMQLANTTLLNKTQFLQDSVDLYDQQIEDAGLNRDAIIGKKYTKIMDQVKELKRGREAMSKVAQPQTETSFNIDDIQVEILPD